MMQIHKTDGEALRTVGASEKSTSTPTPSTTFFISCFHDFMLSCFSYTSSGFTSIAYS